MNRRARGPSLQRPDLHAPGQGGVRRLLWAVAFSARGLRVAWRGEAAFRLECLLLAVAVPLALWLGTSGTERALLIGVVVLVLVVELLNTAIEAAIDRVGPEDHPLSARAKDLGSAAVFVTLGLALLVWLLVLWG